MSGEKTEKEIAIDARDRALADGAEYVIVMVGRKTGNHYVAWGNDNGLAARGMLEICSQVMRERLSSDHASSTVVIQGGAGGGGGMG